MIQQVWQAARFPVLSLLAALTVASITPVAAQADWSSVDLDMKAIQDNMTNLAARVKAAERGSSQINSRNEVKSRVSVRSCCSKNLKAINSHTRELLDNLRAFAVDTEAAGDEAGTDRLTHAVKALLTFHESFRAVADASGAQAVERSMTAAVRDFNHLQRALNEYVECCLEKPVDQTDDSDKPHESGKKKKKKDASDGA